MANRWAPWFEGGISASGDVTINSTTAAAITGATATFTAKVATQITIISIWDVEVVTPGAEFLGECTSGGTPKTTKAVYKSATAGDRATIIQCFTEALAAGATVTLALQGKIGSAGSSYTVHQTNTRVFFLATPSEGVSF